MFIWSHSAELMLVHYSQLEGKKGGRVAILDMLVFIHSQVPITAGTWLCQRKKGEETLPDDTFSQYLLNAG